MIAKRLFDIISSAVVLVVLSPFFCITSIWIKLDSTGPVFFRQTRVGRLGRHFEIHKFRTMQQIQGVGSLQITVGADARITRSGVFLRRYKIDELPQLIDVFIGKMSIVGPRPEVPKYIATYSEELRRRILSVRPGITDWASLRFRAESTLLEAASDPEREYVEKILPLKQSYYLRYVDSRSFVEDLKIIFFTLYYVFIRTKD